MLYWIWWKHSNFNILIQSQKWKLLTQSYRTLHRCRGLCRAGELKFLKNTQWVNCHKQILWVEQSVQNAHFYCRREASVLSYPARTRYTAQRRVNALNFRIILSYLATNLMAFFSNLKHQVRNRVETCDWLLFAHNVFPLFATAKHKTVLQLHGICVGVEVIISHHIYCAANTCK